MTSVLEVRGLSAGYGPLRVLHEVDLAVSQGERVGLVGLNGHGKTTLLRSIMGLVDWRVGEIELDGKSIVRTPTHKLARAGVVLMPQGDALFPRLAGRLGQSAGTLSGGERRMCSLGRGLMADARVYLIDEPSLGLAPGIVAGLFATLRQLHPEGGALILAEQNQTLLEGWIDRIVQLHGGQIVRIEPGVASSNGGAAEAAGQGEGT
jgi:branched-chain amino acid transport system ATP-binding protein